MIRSKLCENIRHFYGIGFQSLFSWMIRSKCILRAAMVQVEKFQSLFSWMIRSKFSCHEFSLLAVIVSILVLLDDSLEVCEDIRHFYGIGFQSLFSWMIRSKNSVAYLPKPDRLFQSLFSWMIRSKDRVRLASGFTWRFQSLFSWMIRSKNLYAPIGESKTCFNPCSLG